jgi:hypothetical protein
VNADSQLVRFAFYGALYSMQPSDPRVSKLNEKFKAEEEDAFLTFVLDEIDAKGTRNNILLDNEIGVLQAPVPRVISSMDELCGVAIADFSPHAPSYDNIEENGVDRILSEDFKELEKLSVVEFLDYIAFTWDLAYPKALYLAVANPFITFDCEIPSHETRTYDSEWEFYSGYSNGICAALPGDFYDIFLTIPRVRTFYSLRHIVERMEDENGNIFWDPYPSILFTRSDLASEQRTHYILDQLDKHSDHIAVIDSSEVMDGDGFIDVEMSCLFEADNEVHQKIFEANSESLNLALLLNPSISDSLRSQIEATGVQVEFHEDFDGISLLIEQALEYNDPGLAEILSDLD